MKIKLVFLTLALSSLFFSGCASGPSFSEYKAQIPPVAADQGRIYLYRTTTLGAALQPSININGHVVGSSKAQGFFYYDCAPGDYVIETSTEVTRKLSLRIAQGQERYVRFGVSMGFLAGHVYPELVDNLVGASEIQGCKYNTGK